ncbi:MAG: class I SAM-dependent methyltransferase [Phycisphaerales bacterium]|nr:MAG: class I SAM-dependent methyltransferase [Phycisphaerales bacterium]
MPMPTGFETCIAELLETTKNIEGFLSEREVRFLALLAACPTAEGEILEIGSFKGKSTIVLAKSALLTGKDNVVAVDPLTSPSITDPALSGAESSLKDLQANLRDAGVENCVEFHHEYSSELAEGWNRNVRLLWIDGDHTYSGTKADFEMFSPFLVNGGIVAMHDVVHVSRAFEGPIRVFMEDVLLSGSFGPAGICGSIGWAQYLEDSNTGLKYGHKKADLHRRLSRLLPYHLSRRDPKGFVKIMYKILRSRIPHSEVDPAEWLRKVVFVE